METIGVVGLGLLGRGITTCLLAHGFHVVACETDNSARVEAERHISDALEELRQRSSSTPIDLEWRDRLTLAGDLEQFGKCNFVIESIFEDLEAKRALYAALEALLDVRVPIASNTSALPISLLQQGASHPERFVGMHWAEPCHLTQFLEVIRGELTNDETVEHAMDLGRRVGKDPALVRKDVEGFIVNRLGYALYREAFWLLEQEVADIETIDRSFRNAFSVWADIAGPFRWMDLTGLPAYAAVMERLFPQLSTRTDVPEKMRELVERGANGIEAGEGFYSYSADEADAWRKLLHEHAWRIKDWHERNRVSK